MDEGQADDGQRKLELPATMDNWEQLFGFARSEANRVLKSNQKEYGLVLACEELLSNMIRHNSGTTIDGAPITISIESSQAAASGKSAFCLHISDNGPAFDPSFESINAEIPEIAIAERKIGGLGLFLIKTSVDAVSYEHSNGRNRYKLETSI